jgi:tetratricopeptide (TPR) repeat protein
MAPAADSLHRCVVLPLVGQDPHLPFVGMALHFLFGNLIVLHPGFQEFWFGWRVARIFPAKEDLSAYRRAGAPAPEPISTGRREQIRFWISGTVSPPSPSPLLNLSLTDAEAEQHHRAPQMVVDTDGHLVGLRRRFTAWLADCGHPFPPDQQEKTLWPEEATAAGLDAVGRALEVFYLQSAYGGKAPVATEPFERAVAAAPGAFMSHDLLGWALYRNERFEKAREAFEKSIRINPHGAGAMAGLIWCAVMTGNSEDALSWAARKAESCAGDIEAARERALRLLDKHAKG